MACYLCDYPTVNLIKQQIRNDSDAHVVECTECGLQWIPKLLDQDPATLDHYYSSMEYRGERVDYEGELEERYNRDRAFALKRRDGCLAHGIFVGKNVLDIGAGTGAFINVAAQSGAKELVAVEPNDQDRQFIMDMHTNSTNLMSTYPYLSDLPDALRSYFDLITLFHVVEHVQDPRELIRDALEFLSPTGVMIIETPNANDVMIGVYKVPAFRDQWYQSAHIWYFTHQTLSRLCQSVSGLDPTWQTGGSWQNNRAAGYVQRYGLSNHLQWMVGTDKPGQELLPFLGNNHQYDQELIKSGKADTLWFALKKERTEA